MLEFLYLSFLALLFWCTQKLTDGHHEHWLNFFPYAKIFFWIVAGIITFFLISYNETLLVTYFSLLLYWFFLLKVDNHWHMITAIFMMFWVLYYGNIYGNFPIYIILFMFLWYVFLNFIRKKWNIKFLTSFFKYKLHFFIPPIIYAFYANDFYAFSMVLFNLIGTYFAVYIFKIK